MTASTRYRFFSDANRAGFEDDLAEHNVETRRDGDEVTVFGVVPFWAHQIALDTGAILVSDDSAYSPTSGVDGFLDTASTSTRSNPPDAIRGQAVIDASKQIVSQPGRTPRRKTRGQP